MATPGSIVRKVLKQKGITVQSTRTVSFADLTGLDGVFVRVAPNDLERAREAAREATAALGAGYRIIIH